MTKLSEHFTLEEFLASDTARAYKIENKPSTLQIVIMKHTAEYLLEPLRTLLNEHYGTKVRMILTSGFRCLALNKKVGGSSTSEHLTGQAVDFKAEKFIGGTWVLIPYTEIYELIKKWVKECKLSVNQCILEKSGNTWWVHVSHHNAGKTRDKRQFLKYNNGSYTLDVVIK